MIYGPYSRSYCLRIFRRASDFHKLCESKQIYAAYDNSVSISIVKEFSRSNPSQCDESNDYYIRTDIHYLQCRLTRLTSLMLEDVVILKK